MCKALCEYNTENPTSTQKRLQQWVSEKFKLTSEPNNNINTIKRSSEYLSTNIEKGDAKCHKTAKFPKLEKVLNE